MRYPKLEEFINDSIILLKKGEEYYNGRQVLDKLRHSNCDLSIKEAYVEIRREDVELFLAYKDNYKNHIIAKELEEYLICETLHDNKVFNAWKSVYVDLFESRTEYDYIISFIDSNKNDIRNTSGLHRSTFDDPILFSKYIIGAIRDRLFSLNWEVDKIIDRYGLKVDTCFVYDVLFNPEELNSDNDHTESRRDYVGKPSMDESAFHRYVEKGYNVENVREEIKNKVMGKKGAAAVDVFIEFIKNGKIVHEQIPFKLAKLVFEIDGTHQAYNSAFRKYKNMISGEIIV